MRDDEFCSTKLALGIGTSSGNPMPTRLEKRSVLSLELSLVDEGQSSRNSDDNNNGGESRKKLRLSKEQSAVLEDKFRKHTTLNTAQKNELAGMLGLKPRQVEVWFQNRRARTKLKQTETDCELWKNHCDNLIEENGKLKKEIEDLKSLRTAFYAQITNCVGISVCPACKKVKGVGNNSSNTGGDVVIKQEISTATAAVSSKDVVQNITNYKPNGLKIRG